jgi:Uma2 family endonuclease
VSTNNALATTLADHLIELGGISADRILLTPPPHQATLADLIRVNESADKGLFELIDGTLVEKAMSYEASVVAATILRILGNFIAKHRLGLISGADGFFKLSTTTRGPDVAFVAWNRLPSGVFPAQLYPSIAPNLVVEVLSPGNTKAEMARKRLEYFHAGVELVWMVDCTHRSVAAYTSPNNVRVFGEEVTIDCGTVLPDFTTSVADFFVDLDFGQPVA